MSRSNIPIKEVFIAVLRNWQRHLAAACLALLLVPGALGKSHPLTFDHRSEPSSTDWRYFLRLPDVSQEKLWRDFKGRQISLKQWSWGWRLGWVRACQSSRKKFCDDVLNQAIFDRALVVRAEGVSALGRIYESTQNQGAIDRLAKVGMDPRNFRHGKPLYIQKRVIFALQQIKGSESVRVAQNVAKSHKELQTYLEKIRN